MIHRPTPSDESSGSKKLDLRDPGRGGSELSLEPGLLLIGLSWGAVLALSLAGTGARVATSWGGRVAILFLCLFVGLTHGGALGALFGKLARLGPAERHPRATTWVVAAVAALGYSWLGLSIAKFSRVGAHLRYEDLWFLAQGSAQIGGEATAVERGLLVAAALLPFTLFALALAALRLGRRLLPAWGVREAATLGLLALAGTGAVAWGHPDARAFGAARLPIPAAWLAARGEPGVGDPGGETSRIGAPIRAFPTSSSKHSWDVLVLMLESIPWKRLHGPEARPEATPRLEELAREGVVFDRAYATSTHSDYAQTSILASLHPRKYPGHDYFRDLDYPRTLFWDPLAGLGYRTAVFSCQNENWGNMIAFLRTPNLQLLRHAPDWPEAPHRGDGSESKVFEATPVAAFFDWLDREPERPFAVYLNFQATHYPYVVPEGFAGPYGPAEIDFPTTFLSYPREKIPVMLDRFHNALAYVDSQVGAVVDGLAARGRLATTALLVVSDHGEAFYEHGLPTHGTTLLEEQARTAMLLRLPGAAPRRVAAPVSVLDGVPLIYRALGLPRHGNFQGRDDVLEAGYSGAGRAIPMTIQGMTREDGLVSGDWKYLVNWDRRERALFDLVSDPEERRNLAAAAPLELERLDRELRLLLERQLGYYAARGWERGVYPPPLP